MSGDDVVLHLRGRVLLGPDEERPEAWVVGGRITYEAPLARVDEAQDVEGWVLPGLVDAHCHIGLDAHGAVDEQTQERQAVADRDAGTLLIRDAGSAGRHPLDRRPRRPAEDRPRRPAHRPARSGTSATSATRSSPASSRTSSAPRPARGDGWVKLVGDWIDREIGDLAPCWPRRRAARRPWRPAHEEGARVTAHCFGEDCLPDLARGRASTASSTARA